MQSIAIRTSADELLITCQRPTLPSVGDLRLVVFDGAATQEYRLVRASVEPDDEGLPGS